MYYPEKLRETIRLTGTKVTYLADQMGITRETLYNKVRGRREFKTSEIMTLSQLLHLSSRERDEIFFAK